MLIEIAPNISAGKSEIASAHEAFSHAISDDPAAEAAAAVAEAIAALSPPGEEKPKRGRPLAGRAEVVPDRVKARLLDLKRTATDAARLGGLERTYIADLLQGRKTKVNARNLEKLAAALRCSPAYLTGRSASPGRHKPKDLPMVEGLPVVGAIGAELGELPAPASPVAADPRYVGMNQALYAAPEGLAPLGVGPNAWLLTVDAVEYKARLGGWRDGQLLIVGLGEDGGEGEELHVYRAVRFPTRVELHPIAGGEALVVGEVPEGRVVRIAAVILRAVQELA